MAELTVDAPYLMVVSTGTTPVGDTNARFLLGVVNLASAAQTATVALTNNAGASAAVPQILALAASAVISYPYPGLPIVGFQATASGAVTTGIAFLYRTNVG